MAAPVPGERTLEQTPTWAVAILCAIIVIISVVIEHGIHSLAKWFQKKHKKAMLEALEKIKAELMLTGFISLLLTLGQEHIAKISVPTKVGDTMLPCMKKDDKLPRGKVSLFSQSGVHQLHIFIFVLAVFHVLYSVITMALGQAKMKRWKAWELSVKDSLEHQFADDPAAFRFTHQTTFVRRHAAVTRTPGLRWIVAFFRQFIGSISKVDFLTMRHGFINAHLAPNSKFDFYKYIKRSLEDDFKEVVGISIPLWSSAFVCLLLNVYGWHTLLWIAFVPLIILVLVGMKLEVVIMEMAEQIQDRMSIVKGTPVIKPSNQFFWFNRPWWILFLIHFTLFQNAFQMAYSLWIWYSFGLNSCFHEDVPIFLTRVIMSLALQFLCSYITFPLYALATQMGSHMKKAIFEEQTAKALTKWREGARKKRKQKKEGGEVASGHVSGEVTPIQGSSPIHLLHKNKSHSVEMESMPNSPRSYQSNNLSEMEGPAMVTRHVQEPTT
ncbi:hypothetical protein MRB53_022658 [Persea americana]|uniref:Uncharacterized protein n=1 Tax=Persea americana TaxID=3435 RepID=A0ACC2L7M4_PERAE|nr:hypothetical protein MRB53_022658 [Persea americana]